MNVKYDYPYGFCEKLHYNGLWPVKYEGAPGDYHKVEMACTCGDGECKFGCKVLEVAREIIPVEDEWLLKDELMGS